MDRSVLFVRVITIPWLWLVLTSVSGVAWGDPPDTARQAELRNLVVHDCGSCHGLTLQGGLGPALTPEALRGKHAEFLAVTILYGRPGTPMPPWRPFLTDQETAWLVNQLKAGVVTP